MFARAFGYSCLLARARATQFGVNLRLARCCDPIGCALSSVQPCPSRGWVPASQLGSEDLPLRQGRRPAQKVRPPRPPTFATSFLPAQWQCARLSTRLSCVYAHCAQATCATTDHTAASTAVPAYVCSRVWAVVLGRLRARAFCAMCAALPLEGLAGLWAASGGQEAAGCGLFACPARVGPGRDRWGGWDAWARAWGGLSCTLVHACV